MSYIISIFILVIFILLIVIFVLYKKVKTEKEDGKVGSGLGQYNVKMREKKAEEKAKILELLNNKGRITNNDVEKILKVSDASATNYLDELEKDGGIEQIGKSGRSVYYQLKK